MRRNVCVITGTRAEYGLLYCLLKGLDSDDRFDLRLIVTGMHLETQFGTTADTIERDGFKIDVRVPIDLSDDSPLSIAHSLSFAVKGIATALHDLQPDILVMLGDRYEMLAAAEAAMLLQIPIAHIHGGEATEGLIDEAIRHSITKMSHLHFATAEAYRRRIIQLGEDPKRVFNVGAVGLDHLDSLTLLDRSELSDSIQFELDTPYFLVTYHPVTLSDQNPAAAVKALLGAFESFPNHKLIITGVNADPGNNSVSNAFSDFASTQLDRIFLTTSLGQLRYLSAMKHADAVIGNSSSGILEAPALKIPTVNIGDRQRGRLRADSVIDCAEDKTEIIYAIKRAIGEHFRAEYINSIYPFGEPGASKKIQEILAITPLDGILMKTFHDVPVPE